MKYFFILFFIILSGCTSTKRTITSNVTLGTNFNKYQTYSFLHTTDTSFTKQGVNRYKFAHAFAKETMAQLSKRGMHFDTVHPDCFFRYNLKVNTSYEVGNYANVAYSDQTYNDEIKPETEKLYIFNTENKPMVYGETIDIDTLREGSLIIEMIDAKTDSIVWWSKTVGQKDIRDIGPLTQEIHDAIPKMFKRFPK